MFVHHVDHPVAKSPEREQQDEGDEGEEDVPSIIQHEHAAFRRKARIERSRWRLGCAHDCDLDRFVLNVTPICARRQDRARNSGRPRSRKVRV